MAKRLSETAAADDFTAAENALTGNAEAHVIVTDKRAVAKHLKALDSAFDACKKAFFTIGFNLYWLYDTLAFRDIGGTEYGSITDFAKERYGISRATTYQYIAVIQRFGKVNPVTHEIDAIKDGYTEYGSTALIVMSSMTDGQLARCTPGMKVKELKKILAETDCGIDRDDDCDDDRDGDCGGSGTETAPPGIKPKKEKRAAELYNIRDAADFEARSKEIFDGIRNTLSQKDPGVEYRISIVMTWE